MPETNVHITTSIPLGMKIPTEGNCVSWKHLIEAAEGILLVKKITCEISTNTVKGNAWKFPKEFRNPLMDEIIPDSREAPETTPPKRNTPPRKTNNTQNSGTSSNTTSSSAIPPNTSSESTSGALNYSTHWDESWGPIVMRDLIIWSQQFTFGFKQSTDIAKICAFFGSYNYELNLKRYLDSTCVTCKIIYP